MSKDQTLSDIDADLKAADANAQRPSSSVWQPLRDRNFPSLEERAERDAYERAQER